MGQALQSRVIRSGEYVPTVPRSGGEGDAVIWRKMNLITRGRDGRYYEEVYGGELDIDEDAPLVELTGTLAITAGSTTITGTGTLFLTELNIGQRVLIIDEVGMQTFLIVPKRIISDTVYECWRAPDDTLSGESGWRMTTLGAVNNKRYTMLWGKIMELDRGSILSVGQGVVRINGATLNTNSLTATRQPKISVRTAAGVYTNYTLGMVQPTAPTLSAVAGGTKGMRAGNYSVLVTPNRLATAGYNNPSLRADVTIANNDKIRVDMAVGDTTNGQDAWGIWVTPYSASLTSDLNYLQGPWFFLREVAVADLVGGSGGYVEIEYYDSEIEGQEIVSFDNDPPPQALFVEELNSAPVWISSRGPSFTRTGPTITEDPSPGPFVCPAKPNNIEAAPANIQASSSPPETIIGSLASADGRIFLLTGDHLQIAQSTPDPAIPIIVRPFWKDGFASPDQLVFHNGNLYGFTMGGPAKSEGDGVEREAEKAWASKVAEITDTWIPGHVMVAYDPRCDGICFFHIADSLNGWGFWMTRVLVWGLSQGFWISDIMIGIDQDDHDSIVCGVATVGDNLYIAKGGRRIS